MWRLHNNGFEPMLGNLLFAKTAHARGHHKVIHRTRCLFNIIMKSSTKPVSYKRLQCILLVQLWELGHMVQRGSFFFGGVCSGETLNSSAWSRNISASPPLDPPPPPEMRAYRHLPRVQGQLSVTAFLAAPLCWPAFWPICGLGRIPCLPASGLPAP